jgi:DNA-binding beta-propeller fold protein YncE
VAVDPLTGDVYVIASVGNIMVVIDRESDVKQIELLKEKTFRQPEGITFNAAGDLFISSEGRGGKAVVVTFRRQTTGDKSNKNNE